MNYQAPKIERKLDPLTVGLTVLLVAIVGYGAYDFLSGNKEARKTEVAEASRVAAPAPVQVRSATKAATTTAPAASTNEATQPALTDDEVRVRFAQDLRDINQCLGMNVPAPLDRVDPTLDNMLEAVKPDIGEQVLQTEDSSTADIVTPSGERRRLKVDMDYSGADRIVRRVQYFHVNGETMDPITLDSTQAVDPSETFIASLEEDGEVTSREKTERVYFGGGEEMIISEKDGKIADLTVNRNGKTFHCRPSDPAQTSCECQ